MSDVSKKIELPYLHYVAVAANVGTFCLIASGFFLAFKTSFFGLENSSNLTATPQSDIDTFILAAYLVASSLSGEYIESVIAMTENPKQFYSSVRLVSKKRERYYESKAAFIQSLIFTPAACYSLSFINEEIIFQASIAIVLVVVINIICFGIIHYYKKFYR